MKTNHPCVAEMIDVENWSLFPCPAPGIVEREGEWYCERHDPERVRKMHLAAIEERTKADAETARVQEERDKFKAVADAARDVVDMEPCRPDHHGYCQTHRWLQKGECPQARLKRALIEAGYELK